MVQNLYDLFGLCNIKELKVLIHCPECNEKYWYFIHPDDTEYLKCGECYNILPLEVE